MKVEEGISPELKRAGVAAETIRAALGKWREHELIAIVTALAQAPTKITELMEIQVRARSWYSLTKELETVINAGKE